MKKSFKDIEKYFFIFLVLFVALALIYLNDQKTIGLAILEINDTDTEESRAYINLSPDLSHGEYLSEVFDVEKISKWNNLTWNMGMCYSCELPNDNTVETEDLGANMQGNLLLLHMNDFLLTQNDTSGNGNFAFCSGSSCPGISAGRYKYSFNFNGIEDYLEVKADAFSNLEFGAIEAWIYTLNSTKGAVFSTVNKNNFFNFYLEQGSLASGLKIDNKYKWKGTGNSIIEAGKWTHVAFKVNSSGNYLFVNGLQQEVNYTKGSIVANEFLNDISATQNNYIGKNPEEEFFSGRIDEFAVYDRELTNKEIENRYIRGIISFNLSLKSCDDNLCNGEDWAETYTTSPSNINIQNNRYVQFKATLLTENNLYTPEFDSLKIDYDNINSPPSIIISSPANNQIIDKNSITLTAIVDDDSLSTIHFYGDGILLKEQQNTGSFTIQDWDNLSLGIHNWTVIAIDEANTVSQTNYFLIIDLQLECSANYTNYGGYAIKAEGLLSDGIGSVIEETINLSLTNHNNEVKYQNTTLTNDNGEFFLNISNIPIGNYTLKAESLYNGFERECQTTLNVLPLNQNINSAQSTNSNNSSTDNNADSNSNTGDSQAQSTASGSGSGNSQPSQSSQTATRLSSTSGESSSKNSNEGKTKQESNQSATLEQPVETTETKRPEESFMEKLKIKSLMRKSSIEIIAALAMSIAVIVLFKKKFKL